MNRIDFIKQFTDMISRENPQTVLFVASREFDRFGYREALEKLPCRVVTFTGFEPCPETASVLNGVEVFKTNRCDLIVTVGGGSAIDCAKGIKYYAETDVKILAVPTTAGTGAEVTKTAVLYVDGDKQSVKAPVLIPEYAVFDHTTLKTLPRVQKVATALDAFCHSFEAYISKNATEESRGYSATSLKLFAQFFDAYIEEDESTYEPMMKCSELAGRAINLAQTAAPHAFSYKLHKLLGFAHGQACAVSLVYIWKYMLENGDAETVTLLKEAGALSGFTPETLEQKLKSLGMLPPITMSVTDFEETVYGVNIPRLANNPMTFDVNDIERIYASFIEVM